MQEQRVWLHCDRDLLLGRRNSLLLSRLLHAQQPFGSAGYSGRIVMDLKLIRGVLEDEIDRRRRGEYLLIRDRAI